MGQTVADRYRIDGLIGEGGLGSVYRAVHLPSGQFLALKTLRPDLDATQEMLARLEREAKATSAMNHRHIVEVLDMGRLGDGTLFVVMELADGVSVGELITSGELHPRRALVLARQALEGIGYAHEYGVVHRDLKPDNIMVVREGAPGAEYDVVKLLDFGLVKLMGDAAAEHGNERLTATGIVFGTPAYMAPEQALGKPLDARVDLYAMGVVLFEMLTGRKPFESEDPMRVMQAHAAMPPPALADVSPGQPWWTPAMEALVARALVKEPGDRYPNAAAMIAAIDAAFLSTNHLPNPPRQSS